MTDNVAHFCIQFPTDHGGVRKRIRPQILSYRTSIKVYRPVLKLDIKNQVTPETSFLQSITEYETINIRELLKGVTTEINIAQALLTVKLACLAANSCAIDEIHTHIHNRLFNYINHNRFSSSFCYFIGYRIKKIFTKLYADTAVEKILSQN